MQIPKSSTKDMEKAFRVASKIADKVIIMDRDPDTIKTAARMMAGHVEDPVSKLKELDIDITPELEELKQVFAEISGGKVGKQKPQEFQRVMKDTLTSSILKVELLSLLKALEYTNYSTEAVENVIKELEAKIGGITSREGLSVEGLFEAGLYALVFHYLRRRDFRRVKRLIESIQ